MAIVRIFIHMITRIIVRSCVYFAIFYKLEMIIKFEVILVIIVFISYTEPEPQKKQIKELTKYKPQAKFNQENSSVTNKLHKKQLRELPMNKPKMHVKQENKMPINESPKTKPKINNNNNIPKYKLGTKVRQENNEPKNKPQNSQKTNTEKNKQQIKLYQKKNTQSKPQAKQWNSISKTIPQTNHKIDVPNQKNIAGNKFQLNQRNNLPMNKPPAPFVWGNNFPTNAPETKLRYGNMIPENILELNKDHPLLRDSVLEFRRAMTMPTKITEKDQWNNIIDDFQELNKGPKGKKKKWKFRDYLRKYEPSTIWEQIDKQRKYNGRNISDKEQTDIMIRAMDPTDEIMRLKIEDGDPKIVVQPEGRRGWKPMKGLHPFEKDRFQLRRRLYELMKQAIYQTRNKMITMQVYREKYKDSALYKMGFLTNKADTGAKTFAKFSFRAFRACVGVREGEINHKVTLYELLSVNERQLHLWFNVELIVDLINKNDVICKEIFANQSVGRKDTFDEKFVNK